jgi:Tol biopolymer transport system component
MKCRLGCSYLILTLLVALAPLPAHATFPGKNGRIAFVQDGEIFTMNPDGTSVTQITHLGPDNSALWESWSPDGKLIVFSEFPPPDFNGQLWIMNTDGSNQRLLLAESGITEVRASFSPDGKSIVFSRGRNFNPDNGNPFVVEMYRIGLEGTGLTSLTRHSALGVHDYGPKYSPDGSTIVFQGMTAAGLWEQRGSVTRTDLTCASSRPLPFQLEGRTGHPTEKRSRSRPTVAIHRTRPSRS